MQRRQNLYIVITNLQVLNQVAPSWNSLVLEVIREESMYGIDEYNFEGSKTVWSLEGKNPSMVTMIDAGSEKEGSPLVETVQDWHFPKLCAVVYLRYS
ncbi:unnamed protein product [Cochlearia groenlandica]